MLDTDTPTPVVKTYKVVNLWLKNPAKNMDKVYRLECQSVDSVNGVRRYAVFGMYGRRGKALSMHILLDNTTLATAQDVLYAKWKALVAKGYVEVHEELVNDGPLSTAQLTRKVP